MRGCRCDACRQASRDYHTHHRHAATSREPQFPAAPPPPGPWVEQAACRGSDPDVFFPSPGSRVDHLRRICAACPVQPDCLDWALVAYTNRSDHGFYGGSTPRERRDLRRAAS